MEDGDVKMIELRTIFTLKFKQWTLNQSTLTWSTTACQPRWSDTTQCRLGESSLVTQVRGLWLRMCFKELATNQKPYKPPCSNLTAKKNKPIDLLAPCPLKFLQTMYLANSQWLYSYITPYLTVSLSLSLSEPIHGFWELEGFVFLLFGRRS